ncbi:MAG: amidohydrolase family protein [Myxococcota bacterium]
MVNTGAHGQLAGLAEHWEIWMFAQGGMTPLEALRSATLSPAKTLGMADQIGSIEAGKLADLVVLDKNPLQNIRNTDSVRMVMLNGRLYDAATMDQIGNDIDDVGTKAFGDGPNSLGIGKWWGVAEGRGPSHFGCSCDHP